MEAINLEEYRHKNRKKNKKSKLPTVVIYCLLIIVGIYFFLNSPFFNIKNIEINGNYLLEEERIIELGQINYQQNLINIKKKQIVERILVHPLAKEVQITRRLPNTLLIELLERKPVGLLVCQDGYIQVSEDGYFLALMKNTGDYQIPVISGIDMDYLPGPGQEIKNPTLLKVLDMINQSDNHVLSYLAEINLKDDQQIFAFTKTGVEIRFGTMERMEVKLTNLDLVLNEIIDKRIDEQGIEYIDLRFAGPPIIKKKI